MGIMSLVLTYAVGLGLLDVWQADPWAEMGPILSILGRTQIVALIAIPLGGFLAAIWPRLWPLPLAALLWALIVTVLIEPGEFDFLINWLLGFTK